ncbi:AAEL009605-PA [Aedes aegypti]|uniref:AAEL009605-PA n=1 Tax=Aedes aegypti TaxID=7159 RepID=Q16VB5_AEDAE|nr:AAEL009605-PA [Aedes aegypti]
MDTYAEGKLDVEGLHMLVVRAESIVNTRRTDTTESELLLVTLDSRISADHQMSNESTTGTYVNNRKFCKEHPGSTILSEGDLIGIGTPCYQDESFYRENVHVLLFQVCKDRNRIVREGNVEVILASDEEPEDVKVFDLDRSAEHGQVPAPAQRDERLYRIVERIDLSSDDETKQDLQSSERAARLDERIFEEKEKKAKELGKTNHHEEIDLTKEAQANKENKLHQRHNESESLQNQAEESNKKRDKHKEKRSDSRTHHHRDRKKSSEKTETKSKDTEKLKDEIDELFQDSYSYPERSESQNKILSISLDDSDEDELDFSELALTQSYYRQVKKELLEVESQEEEPEPEPAIVRQIKAEKVSPKRTPVAFDDAPIYIEDDDEDEDYLEDSKRWFQRLSQKSSPLKTKASSGDEEVPIIKALPSEKPIELDEYCSRDLDIPDDILDVFKEPEPVPEKSSPEHNLSGINRLPSVDKSAPMDVSIENADEFLDNFFNELEDDDQQMPIQHSTDVLNPPGSVPSAAPRSVSKTLLLKSPDAARTPMNEKISDSASKAWISKKVPVIEPHHILKRRTSVSAASLSKKPPKMPKLSPVRKPEVTKEVRKQKLKEITAKKNQANDGDSKHKSITKPKVKFTPCNRGAFLTEPVPGPSKSSTHPQEAGIGGIDGEDLICTQSTSLTNVPPIDDLIDIAITKAPKLTFNSVAKVSRVAQNAPAFKIPKRRPSTTQKEPSDSIQSILENITFPATTASKLPPIEQTTTNNNMPAWKRPSLPTPTFSSNAPRSSHLKSILKSPCAKRVPKKRVKWSESLVQTRTFDIEEGHYMTVQTKMFKDNTNFFRDMSQESCQNEIIKDITGWNADWFDNPSAAAINGNQPLLPMVEEYADFEDYKRIVLPILKTELFHDILGQYVEVKKRAQEPIQMKVNQIRGQGRTFVMNCSGEYHLQNIKLGSKIFRLGNVGI